MPQFLSIAHRLLLLSYLVLFLPVILVVLSGRSNAFIDHTPWKRMIDRQRTQVIEKSKMTVLNLYKPENFQVLYQLRQDPSSASLPVLDWYIRYFKELTQVLPPPLNADAYAMLGFCYFHQNQMTQALESYQASIAANPAFVWTYYNLAVVYFRLGEFEKASGLISQMLKLNADVSMQVLSSSKIYMDILRERNGFNPTQEMAQLYSDALRLLVISQYHLKKFSEVNAAAQYALQSAIAPVEFFRFYLAVASGSDEDRMNAKRVMDSARSQKQFLLTGDDLYPRFF